MSYKAYLLTFAHHPAHSVITDSWYDWFLDSPNYRSFNLLASNFFSGSFKIRKLYAPCNPLWRLPPCQIDLSLRNIVSSTNPLAANQLFSEHTSNNYNNYLLLYTDGSKTDLGTSSALFVHRHDVKRVIKINNKATVYTAELYAITTALIWISKTRYAKNLIISDSLISITAIHNHETNYRHLLVEKVKMLHYFLDSIGVEVVYLWVPAHCGIKGNEIADTLARIATGRMESHHLDPSTITRSEANLELPFSDTKLMINNYCISLWQKHCESISTGFQYKQCFPPVRNLNILNSSQIFRLQIGHC